MPSDPTHVLDHPLRWGWLLAGAATLCATLACEPRPLDGWTCGSDGLPTAECPAEPCSAACPDVDAAIDCCLARPGAYGLDAEAAEQLAARCPPETCDPDALISRSAALCLALVQGASHGDGACVAVDLEVHDGQADWSVWTNADRHTYELVTIDANTGARQPGVGTVHAATSR